MLLDENPEWRFTIIVLAICTVINSTLPIWLGIANCLDHKKKSANAKAALDENESDSEDESVEGYIKHVLSAISDAPSSVISSQVSTILEARPGKKGRVNHKKRRKRERDIRSAIGVSNCNVVELVIDEYEIVPGSPNIPPSRSAMSRLNTDDISMTEGVNEAEGAKPRIQASEKRTCGQALLEMSEWDSSLASLAGFYMIQRLVSAASEIIQVAIISHAVGITQANAFIMVQFLMTLMFTIVAGFQEAIGVLVPQADGADNDLMVGRYLQIGTVFSILFLVPGFVVWSLYMYETILWFGFDEATAITAQDYTHCILAAKLAENIDLCLTEFLDVIDRELYVTIYSVVLECLKSGTLVALAYSGVSSMVTIGLAQTAVSVTMLFLNTAIVMKKGWLDDYEEGLFNTCGLKDFRAMQTTFVTAIPLAIAWFLTIGEWQVMLMFAQSIGPAEVAVWNLLGYIWDLFETMTEAISEAAEVRVAFRMGAGRPQEARKTSERSIYLGTQLGIITAGILFATTEYILPLLTPNLVYQKLIFDQIPLIGFTGILMVPGLVIEGILCAQGRVRLMTTIEIISSWFIAIPLAAVLVYYFKFSLEGVVVGLVVGYSVGVTVLLFFYLRSNWEALSERVIEQNAENGVKYFDADWDELPEEIQQAASALGYTKIIWESNIEPSSAKKTWDELTEAERAAAVVLGYSEKKWNGDSERDDEECDFDDLSEEQKKAAKFLGFTRAIWDNDETIPLQSKPWVELTPSQQQAATTVGLKENWDKISNSSELRSSETPIASEEMNYNDYDFHELPSVARKAAKVLGYTDAIWDFDGYIPIQDSCWKELTAQQQTAARILGYSEEKWDAVSASISQKNSTIMGLAWSDTTESDVSRQWHNRNHKRQPSYGCSLSKYGSYPFDKLPRGIQRAAMDLGFTRSTWDRNLFVPRKQKTWDRLTPIEREAAGLLGCTEEKWEELLDASW